MTTDGDCLRAAILAKPQDDAPRLIYADWLEEHGQGESAAKIRRWVLDLKPAAVRAWHAQQEAPDLTMSANVLQAVPGEWWRLAAVLGQRLAEVKWPVPYEHITTWPAWWDSDRHRQWVLDMRHRTELFSFGLARPAARSAMAAAAAAAWSAGSAAASAGWSAAAAAAAAAAWSAGLAAASAGWSAAAFARLYAAVLAAVTRGGATPARAT